MSVWWDKDEPAQKDEDILKKSRNLDQKTKTSQERSIRRYHTKTWYYNRKEETKNRAAWRIFVLLYQLSHKFMCDKRE